MANYVTREEFEARMRVLENEVEGEKAVTRHVLEHARLNGDDLAAMRAQLAHLADDMVLVKSTLNSHGMRACCAKMWTVYVASSAKRARRCATCAMRCATYARKWAICARKCAGSSPRSASHSRRARRCKAACPLLLAPPSGRRF
jgi:hypothetical protein